MRLGLPVWLLVLVPAGTVSAIERKPSPKPLDRLAFFQPDLTISSSNVPLEKLLEELPNRSSWRDFLSSQAGEDAQVFIDPRSGNPSNIILALPLIPGGGASNILTSDDVAAAVGGPVGEVDAKVVASVVRRFVENHRGVLGVDVGQLGEVRAIQVNPYLWQIHFPQHHWGVPVRYARVTASINHGNLILIGTDTWSTVTISPIPILDSAQALEIGFGYLGGRAIEDVLLEEPTLEIVPYAPAEHQRDEAFAGPVGTGYGHRLVWSFVFRRPPDLARWEVMVDAHTGAVLSLQDINHYAEQDAALHAEQQIKGAVFPLTSTEACPDPPRCGTAQAGYPMPFANTGLAAPNDFTNSGGAFDYTSGQVTTTLAGKYVRINDSCGAINESSTTGGIDLGGTTTQHDCTSGGQSPGDTSASRSAFYELNKVAEEARGWLPTNTWLQSQLTSNVNINATCNAFWNGISVNFYKSGGGCRNTGEIAAVFDHEWGHGLDDNDANGTLSNSSEAYADIAAIYRLQASCVGYGFFHTLNLGCGQTADGTGFNANEAQAGASHCDLNCSGVRDADWDQHADHQPDTALGFVCTSCAGGSGPCGRQVHCAAAPARQAAWDLVARDLQAAPFNLDRHTAFIVGDKLFYQGSGNVANWHACTCGLSSDGCAASNAYMQWLTVDDDNGNLSDGTPHMTALHAAFNRHGIACSTPSPTNSGCSGGPTAAPTVSVTRGQGQNQLSWTSVPNAAKYWVFRTEGHAGCNFGKVLLAEVTGTGYSDTAVATSRDYCYNVVAVGPSGACFGRASACACTSSAAPDFSLACNPASLSVRRGGSGASTCTLTSQNGFAGPVSLSCLDLPAGVTCDYNPNPATPPANGSVSSALTVNVGSSAPTGTTTIRARGVNYTLDRTFNITLQITDQPPTGDFTLQCAPPSLTVRRGQSGTSTCTLTSQNGFSSPVSLDCLNLPSGVSCGFNPNPATPPANGSVNSALTVSVAVSAPTGSSTFTVRGQSGTLDRRFDVSLQIVAGRVPCRNGDAGGYPCRDVDLEAHLPLSAIGGGAGSGSWGWTDPQTGREYALMGRSTGTSFVDISDPQSSVYLGNLPSHTGASPWREIKVHQNHAYIVSDQNGAHGMQIFDLTRLRNVPNPPVTFTETAHYAGFSRAHNIVINEARGFAYAVGTETCAGGLHMMSLANPTSPAFVGCFSADGYTHDAQCVVYDGPDATYHGQEICVASNEDTVTVVGVQDKSAPFLISRRSYPGVGYVHQGWLTEGHRYFLQDDELDERNNGHNTRTYIWDLFDLDNPILLGFYEGPTPAIDHNLYVKGSFAYEANYRAGLRILSLADVGSARLQEVAYFDIYPADDSPAFNGAWNNYPFHRSGIVTVSGIEQGLFILRPQLAGCNPPSAPVLVSPPNGATNVPPTPVLDWSDVTGATSYEVQVATDPSFANVVRSAVNLTSSTWTVSPALDGGVTYHWRARAVNACGPSAWTAGWSFTTQPAGNRPAFDAASSAAAETADLIWPHTVAGSNRFLLVGASIRGNVPVASLTYGGVPLTKVRHDTFGNDVRSELWALVGPPIGTHDVRLSLSSVQNVVAGATSWTNVGQTSPLGNHAGANHGGIPGTTATVQVASGADQLVVDVVATQAQGATVTAGPSQTVRWNRQGNHGNGAGSSAPGAATTTLSWTLAYPEFWAISAVALKPPCAPPPPPGLVSPPNGSTNVAVTPVLDWSDVTGATAYEVQVATDPSFANVVRSAVNLTSSTWTVSPALDGGVTYYWRARAVNACGPSAWTAGFSFTTSSCVASVAPDRWKGEYWNNKDLAGAPVMVRDDGAGFLTFDWGTGSPGAACGLGSDRFSARWTRTINLVAGTHRFTVTSDDGFRLYLDGSRVVFRDAQGQPIETWKDQPPTTYTVDLALAAGSHTVVMEYYENGGLAVARLSWQLVSSCSVAVPSDRWRGEYWNNKDLAGAPVMVRDDGAGFLAFDWGTGSPGAACGLGPDRFSARWTRTINLVAGTHRFTVTSDDGFRLYLDGSRVVFRDAQGQPIETWKDQPPTTYTVDVALAAGGHTVVMEYYENGGLAVARLSWQALGGGSGNAAEILEGGSDVPASMASGETRPVRIRVLNTGGTTWRAGTLHRLGTGPANGFTWSGFACGGYMSNPADGRVFLCSDVPPGASHDFTFNITAPSVSGSVALSVQMVQDAAEWFGERFTWSISVGGAPNPYPGCACRSGIDNYCHIPPGTAGCPMTMPGGYCDPNGDGSYSDADWVRGYYEYAQYCR